MLINTALHSNCRPQPLLLDVAFLGLLDWSSLRSNLAGIRPRIVLRVGGEGMSHLFSPESIRQAQILH
jgi:hypothetical protein